MARLRLPALCAVLALLAAPAAAQSYPSRTIKLVVGFAAGGGNDIIARIIGQKLQERLGQSVVVENKVGAGGQLAAQYLTQEPPDGYTLLVGASGAMVIIPAISVRPPYDPLKDFVPVSMLAAYPLILSVNAETAVKNPHDLVAWANAHSDEANYGSSSPAFTLATEMFKLRTGMPGVAIPYKSSNESLLSVVSRHSLLTISDPPPAIPLISGGKLRALAITDDKRLADLPDVPTMAEAGVPDMNVGLWSGIFVRAGTPPAIVQKLEGEIRGITQLDDVRARFRAIATPVAGSSSAEFARRIEADLALFTKVGKAANVRLE